MSVTSNDKILISSSKRMDHGPTPFNFHCIICFEQFDHEERYPVVLPCGHTYLCAKCSKRIKKCMECRTPLFMVKPTTCQVAGGPASNHQNAGRTSPIVTRGGRRFAAPSPPPTPPPQRQEIPLPLPKNVLLLSLMETAEREANAVRFAKLKRSLNKDDDDEPLFHTNCDMDTIDETALVTNDDTMSLAGECIEEEGCGISAAFSFEEDEDAYIWSTISHISSTCGTYAVADPAGLMVLPNKPSSNTKTLEKNNDDMITSVFENVTLTNIPQISTSDNNTGSSYELPYRSRVQVVHIEDGWAQLARNRGFVYVDSTQLVKVGGPNDKACEIEGMLLQVDNRRKEISRKQSELSRIENGLERELDKALLIQFTDTKRYELDPPEENSDETTIEKSSSAKKAIKEQDDDNNDSSPKQRQQIINSNIARHAIPKTPPPRQLRTPSPSTSPALVTRLLGLPQLSPSPVTVSHTNNDTTNTSNTNSAPSTPHQTKRRTSSRSKPVSPSSVDKIIDFRTGFSGHCALTQSFARHPHPNSRSVHRMMGEHKGLGLPSISRRSTSTHNSNSPLCKSPGSERNTQ